MISKNCCKKCNNVEEENIKDTCIKCVSSLNEIAISFGYDENWIQDLADNTVIDSNNFTCMTMKTLKDMIISLSDKVNFLEVESTNFFNDIKYALHDIQAPVRSIRSFSEKIIASENEDDFDVVDYMNRIYNASLRLTEMLNDLRDIVILGKKKSEHIIKLDFNRIINDSTDNIHSYITDKNAQINILSPEFPTFKSNHLRWVRVFQNIIFNGISYNKSEVPKIDIWSEGKKIFIKDNGMGIPESKYETVFEMFTRLSDREDMASGTGAGLFMCRKFLNMDRCKISIHDSDDNGTTFVIELP